MASALTFGNWLKHARTELNSCEGDIALEARILLAHYTGYDFSRIPLLFDETLSSDEALLLAKALERRTAGEPLAYIIGYTDFYGRDFCVSPAVLIPRADSETVIDVILRRVDQSVASPTFLDLGTGSGCLIQTLLLELTDAKGVAVDVSNAALEIAMQNAKSHELEERLTFKAGSWFAPLAGSSNRFDAILSNPPYIRPDVIDELSATVRDYEPRLALDGGPDGLDCYRKIIGNAYTYLKPGGLLVFEIGYDQGDTVQGLMYDADYSEIEISKDFGGNDRVVSGKLFK